MKRVTRETVLPASPDEVWEALTDPDALSAWFGAEVRIDSPGFLGTEEMVPGARLRFRMPDGSEHAAVVEEAVPGERLAFRWLPVDREPGRVEMELEPDEAGTRVRVVETVVALARPSVGFRAEARVPAGV